MYKILTIQLAEEIVQQTRHEKIMTLFFEALVHGSQLDATITGTYSILSYSLSVPFQTILLNLDSDDDTSNKMPIFSRFVL